jgi:hypothetical protein
MRPTSYHNILWSIRFNIWYRSFSQISSSQRDLSGNILHHVKRLYQITKENISIYKKSRKVPTRGLCKARSQQRINGYIQKKPLRGRREAFLWQQTFECAGGKVRAVTVSKQLYVRRVRCLCFRRFNGYRAAINNAPPPSIRTNVRPRQPFRTPSPTSRVAVPFPRAQSSRTSAQDRCAFVV